MLDLSQGLRETSVEMALIKRRIKRATDEIEENALAEQLLIRKGQVEFYLRKMRKLRNEADYS